MENQSQRLKNPLRKDLLLCFITLSFVQGLSQASPTGNGLLEVRSTTNSSSTHQISVCIFYNSEFQQLTGNLEDTVYHPLVNMTYVDGCDAEDFINPPAPLEGSVVAVSRGHCNFVDKAILVQAVKGSAVLVVNLWNSTDATTIPGGNKSEFESINITLATIGYQSFKSILAVQKPVEVAIYAPPQPLWDGSMIIIIVFSTTFVMIGAGWAAWDESKSVKGSRRRRSNSNDDGEDTTTDVKGSRRNDVPLTIVGVIIWFIIMCGVIILLYFFYNYVVYVFIGIFCIIGAYSMYQCFLPFWSCIMPITYDIPLNRLPGITTKIKLRSFLLLMPCITLSIFWAVERHAKFAWTIQDLLGSTFCIFFIQSFRLPNLKVIAFLLTLLLLYDVFFVFITPFITKGGTSIMESIATGGQSHSKESLPMLFLIPILYDLPGRECRDRDFALLGFGDVIIPGLLVSYNAVFDVKTGTKMVYFLSSSLGYLVGMVACMISLILMNKGQPALLFLVPCTLGATLLLAVIRKEFRKLFLGRHLKKAEDSDNQESRAKESEDGEISHDAVDEEQRNLIN